MDYSIVILFLALILWLSGFYFLYRIPLCDERGRLKNYPTAAIIIPARDEEKNIGNLLDSINAQDFKPNEVIVVNDGSVDMTKEISLAKGASVADSLPLPEGWLGKPWACMQGARASKSDLLVFLDSDTVFEQGGLKKIIDTYIITGPDSVFSILPYHWIDSFYENFSAVFNVIMAGSMNAFTPLSNAIPTGLFGQSLIVRREHYFSIGGHEKAKDKILENVYLAEHFAKAGFPLKCFGGKGALSMRMYPDGFAGLIRGWTKAFASGAGKTGAISLFMIILWITAGNLISVSLPYFAIAGNNVIYWVAMYLLFALQFLWMLKRIGSFGVLSAFMFPVHLAFYCVVFFRSLYYMKSGKATEWKSRKVIS